MLWLGELYGPSDNRIDRKDLGWEKIREGYDGKREKELLPFFKMIFQLYQAKIGRHQTVGRKMLL